MDLADFLGYDSFSFLFAFRLCFAPGCGIVAEYATYTALCAFGLTGLGPRGDKKDTIKQALFCQGVLETAALEAATTCAELQLAFR